MTTSNEGARPYKGYVCVWMLDANGNEVDCASVPQDRVAKIVANFARAQASEGLGGRIEFHAVGSDDGVRFALSRVERSRALAQARGRA